MGKDIERQNEILAEINKQLSAFSVVREFSVWVLVGILFFIGAVLAITLGELLLIVLVIGGGLLFEYIGLKLIDTKLYRKDIAFSLCALMDECLAQNYENDRKVGNAVVSTVQTYGNNLTLYKRFVARFPEMKSFKLWYICSYRGN